MKSVSQMKKPTLVATMPVVPVLRSLPRAEDEAINAGLSAHSLHAELVDPLSESGWDEMTSRHCDATIFHSTAWARVLADTYGHRPCYVLISLNDHLQAIVPLMEVQTVLTRSRGVCLPFSDYCAPLVFSSLGGELLIEKLQQIARERRWSYFEIRNHSLMQLAPVSESYYGHVLDLRIGRDALVSNFSSAAQRAVRKAQRNGLSVRIQSDADGMAKFYKLHVRTRRRHGAPPQPQSFFNNIQRHLVSTGHGFIVIVERQSRPLAAAMFFVFGRHATYKFGASDERFQEFRANNLAMSEGIKRLAVAGAETLHFGRTEKQNEGLRRFKLSWGTTEQEIRYLRFEMANGSWKASGSGSRTFYRGLFRTLPVSLNKLAGAMIYPHLD